MKLPAFSREEILFSAKSFAAAMLAMYVANRAGLPRPFWAMLTSYVVAAPIAGNVRSKALYRFCGTLLGCTATVLIVPALYKGGFIFGGQYGNGVLLAKMADGSWSYPAFYTMEGGSFGLQIGLESTAVIFTIMSDKGLHAVLNNQFKFGADTGLTVLVVGAGIGASTTSSLDTDIYAFSMTGIGLYGGLSLEGTALAPRESWNAAYYGQDVASRAIVLDNSVANPKADALRDILAH